MSISNGPAPQSGLVGPPRQPLRLRLAEPDGVRELDGGWWPRSRDLAVELADLVDLVDRRPPETDRVVRVLFSPQDWDPAAAPHIPIAGGYIEAAPFLRDGAHLVSLATSDLRVWRLLVVPPGFSCLDGERALVAAATNPPARSATELLAALTDDSSAENASGSSQSRAARIRAALPDLLAEVEQARRHEHVEVHARVPGSHTEAITAARRATLRALLDYAAAIESLSWPVPRGIQMEIKMHRVGT